MRLETINGVLHAKAETTKDIKILLKLDKEEVDGNVIKFNRKSECPICGLKVRGNKGLAVHQREKHNQEFISNGKHAIRF